MSENGMDELRELLRPCASGERLLGALRTANLAGGDIPQLIAAVIKEKDKFGHAAPSSGQPAGQTRTPVDDALCVIDGLMFLNPRGKQQLALFPDRCVIKTAKSDISVPWNAVKHVAIIDSIPGDTKGKVLLYLHVASEAKVMNGKTPLSAVVIQSTADAQLDIAHPQGTRRLQGPAPVVLCQALGAVPGGVDPSCFVSPDAQYFQSAGRAAGVTAYVKARQGFIYPLPSAMCFLDSPAIFLPHQQIRSLEMMRAGGGSSTFDLVVHLCDGGVQEFGMLPREEIGAIEDYIRRCRLAIGAAASSGDEQEGEGQEAGSPGAAEANSGSDSDDPEDKDFTPTTSSDDDEEEEANEGAGKQEQQQCFGVSPGKQGMQAATAAVAGDGGGREAGGEEEEAEYESSSEEESSDDDDDDDDDEGDVELVSEDDFSVGQLQGMIASEGGSSGRRSKRQRT